MALVAGVPVNFTDVTGGDPAGGEGVDDGVEEFGDTLTPAPPQPAINNDAAISDANQ